MLPSKKIISVYSATSGHVTAFTVARVLHKLQLAKFIRGMHAQ